MAPRVAVRLAGARTDRHIEAELASPVRYSAAAPGGYKSASFTLTRPLDTLPPELDPYVAVTIYDTATGETLWDGWLEVPGRGNSDGIPLYDVVAVGPQAHAYDVEQPLIYVDGRYSLWERVDDYGTGAAPRASLDTTGGAGEAPGLRMAFPRGLVAAANGRVTVRYPHLIASGQRIGRLTATHIEGRTSAGFSQQFVTRTAGLSGSIDATQTWSTSQQTLVARLGTEITAADKQYADYRAIIPGGSTIGDDVSWSNTTVLRILPSRYTQAGAELVTAADYPNNYVLADQVVADLLGRPGLLPLFDGSGASVSALSTIQFQQLAYEAGTTPGQVLADLMNTDPAFYWAAWERGPTGKYRFEWTPWPTTASIFADVDDGFTAPTSTADLVSTVRVRWQDALQRTNWSTYTQLNPLLTAAGRARSTVVDLGSETGSQTQADAAGAAALDAGLWPVNNGTLTIRRPVVDLVTGRLLQPWQLPRYAGRLVRLRNVESRPDVLNLNDRDGLSVFRMAEVEYDDGARTATVTLDTYEGTVSAALGRLAQRTARVRRP